MQITTLVSVLEQPHVAAEQLERWGLRDIHRAQARLVELAGLGLTLDLLASLCRQLARHLPEQHDPDAALESFQQFLAASRSPLALAALLDRDETALPVLL